MEYREPLELVVGQCLPEPETRDRITPWELRLASLVPVSPISLGVLTAALLAGAASVARSALGLPFYTDQPGSLLDLTIGAQLTVLVAVVFGYVIAAFSYTRAAIASELSVAAGLPPGATGTRHYDALEIDGSLIRRSRFSGAAGAALGAVVLGIGHSVFSSRQSIAWQPSEAALLAFLVLPLFWVLGRVAHLTIQDASHTLPVRPGPLDLNDLESLDVHGRIALRLALAWILGTAIPLLLFFLSPTPNVLALPIIPVLAGILAIAIVSFVLPVRHVHRRIRAGKQAALADVRWQIAQVSRAAIGDRGVPGRLTDLITYEKYLVGLREWPFDTSTLVKFGLFLLIPLGSWSGGAFVERFISMWLD